MIRNWRFHSKIVIFCLTLSIFLKYFPTFLEQGCDELWRIVLYGDRAKQWEDFVLFHCGKHSYILQYIHLNRIKTPIVGGRIAVLKKDYNKTKRSVGLSIKLKVWSKSQCFFVNQSNLLDEKLRYTIKIFFIGKFFSVIFGLTLLFCLIEVKNELLFEWSRCSKSRYQCFNQISFENVAQAKERQTENSSI